MWDLLFNAALLVVDIAIWVAVVRSARPRAASGAVLAGLLAALVLTALFHAGLFELLRLYCYIVFLHVPVVSLGLAWIARERQRAIRACTVAGAIVLWTIAAYAFLIEPHRLQVTHIEIRSANVTQRLRIVVASDLQTDHIGRYERRTLRTVLDAGPDLILMPGDFLQDDSPSRHRLAEQFRSLLVELNFGALLGAFATRGNSEWNDWPELFAGTRVTPLPRTSTFPVGEIELTALDLADSFDPKLEIGGSDRFHIVFGHAPDFALGRIRADLLVAGHTHGGQVRLPLIGPLLTMSSVPRSWVSGVTRLDGGRTLVVSRGIGMERGRAPRLRFLCRPEIVVIDVLPA